MNRKPTAASPERKTAKHSAARQITAHARQHFFTHGFRSVTMDDLADELGMSKKTLYANFPSKAALLKAVIADKLGSVDTAIAEAYGTSEDFPARLSAMLACIRAQAGELQPAFIRDLRREGPEFFSLVQEGRRGIIQRHFGKLLRDGQRAGAIRGDIPAEVMIETLVGAVDAVVTPARQIGRAHV